MISELPSGWMRAPIGSLCSLVNGRAFKPTEWTTKGVPIVRIQNLNNPAASFNHYQGELDARHRLQGGELLFAWSGTPGTSFGAHIWHGQQAALNQHIFRVDFDERLLDKRFFRFAINEKLNELIGVAQGGVGLRHVTKGVFESTEVAVPPREEQTRIADQLDTLLARIQACNDRLDAIPALLKRFRQAVLDAAITGLISQPWRDSLTLTEPAPESPPWAISLGLHPLPSGWRWARFSELLCSLRSGTSAVPSDSQTQYPVLRSSSVRPMGIDLDDVRYLPSLHKVRADDLLTEGDLLFTRLSGSLEYVANCVLVRGLSERRIYYPDRLFRARLENPDLGPYVELCFSSPLLRRYLTVESKSTAGHQRISMGAIRDFPIPLPRDDEQLVIVEKVAQLLGFAGRIDKRHAAAVAVSQRLTPLTLAKAFRGELVQQDPTDEPASLLLQRIAKTPAVAVKAPRGRPRSKQANPSTPLPTVHPDGATLPAGAWAASAQIDEHATAALLIAVLKAWGQPMPQDQARLAAMLCLQPRLFTTALPAHDAAPWRRLVGAEAEPLPASVAALQPAVNAHWRRALAGLRARGDLVASGSSPQDTWALGPGADRVDTTGWPDGRAGWVVAHLRAHGVEAVLPLLPTAAVDFVHARAA